MSKLRIGVIGAGGIANGIHLPVLATEAGVQLQAVCDLQPQKAQAAQQNYGFASCYTSMYEMLQAESLNAVVVLTQPDMLFRAASTALQAGLPVFMEKPMGLSAYQAETLVQLAREQNRTLHVGYNRRYIPLVQEVLRLLRESGGITLAEGRFYKNSSPAFYGGCGSAFACDVLHVIDLVRYAADSTVTKAATLEGLSPQHGRPEAWHSVFRFANGAAGVVRSHYATGGRVHDFEFHGAGISAFVDLGSPNGDCQATVLRAKGLGKQSLSAMGSNEQETLRLDGKQLAGSDAYQTYYGYRAEMQLFLQEVAAGAGFNAARAEADLASAKLVEQLLAARI